MIIPSTLHSFEHPTLIVTSDHVHARFFIAHQNILEEQAHIALPHEDTETREGTPMSPPEYNDDMRLKRFVDDLVKHTEALVETHAIKVIDLVMPAEIEHLLLENCDQNLKNLVKKTINHDLMKEDILSVVERLFA